MKVISSIKINFFFFLFCAYIPFIFSQINDNFELGILEDGNCDLLDVTDYHNMGLIVSSSKAIYVGIPPTKKIETTAKLIKVSALITINDNYLLAACLQDSFLGKINLSNGEFTALLSYSEILSLKTLEIPEYICSLSNIDNDIFIAYSEIITADIEKKSSNTIFKIIIENKDSTEDGPTLLNTEGIKMFDFGGIPIETSSIRQVSCEPLRIVDNPDIYRLICLHEGITTIYIDDVPTANYNVFASSIDSDLTGFKTTVKEFNEDYGKRGLGFRLYREDSTYAKYVTGISVIEIYLSSSGSIQQTSFPIKLYKLDADIDLISYNHLFTFSAKKTSFLGKQDIYSFRINKDTYTNNYEIYNYQENNVKKILGYYNEVRNKIIFLYQTDTNIKYFIIDNMNDIYSFSSSYTDQINVASYQPGIQYDLNNLITSPSLIDLGYLNVDYIKYKISSYSYEYEYFGTDFYDILMSNNILIPEPSLNDWKTYYLSFVDNVENQYIRIYHLESLTISIQTCEFNCNSCWEDYSICTDCSSSDYAVLEDRAGECFPPTYLVDGYLYDSSSNKFLKCYGSCEFCTEISSNSESQKCSSCSSGHLYSYVNLGSCYLYTDLDISQDKIVDNDNNNFITSACSNYKIASTGECIDTCPLTTPYYTYEYSEETSSYEKVFFTAPKYLFNNICYEQCPTDSSPNENNVCICDNYFYIDNTGNTICLPDENCPNDYPYLNQDTKECFSSLENCNYFFIDICYQSNCPSGKVLLSAQSEEVKNYIKEKLSLSDNNLVNKICICDISNSVWSNINANKDYYQECLSSCPTGYIPEEITKQCIVKEVAIPTTINLDIKKDTTNEILNEINNKITSEIINEINDIPTTPTPPTTLTTPIPPPLPPTGEDDKCPTKFENRCYHECPPGTCLTQDDPDLKTCIRTTSSTQVFNNICFENFEEITNNIQSMSENEMIISKSGVIIHGYSTKQTEKKSEDKDANYSLVYLGDCEYKIKSYYNLPNETELFILGIDSPNKDILSSTNVFNYGVYLSNGTLLDHNEACKETKISISSPITNPDIIKLEEAVYFSEMGYDIYDESSNFYNDRCSPAAINGNDIILKDRKNDFYPEGISLCNDSCVYSQIDLNSKRFICECDLSYNYSEKIKKEKNDDETEDDTSYVEYFLSLINYKIGKCYKLFFEYKSYYYNAGFYIAVGTLFFCLLQMLIYLKCGRRSMDLIILENVPDEMKLREIIREQNKRYEEIKIKSNKNNPPKKHKNKTEYDKKEIKKKKSRKTVKVESSKDLKDNRKSKLRNKTFKFNKSYNSEKKLITNNKQMQMPIQSSNDELKIPKNSIVIVNSKVINKSNYSNISRQTYNNDESSKETIDTKELNVLPYAQALRLDNRSCCSIFLSVISHEIKIINIFYYKHPYEHLSIVLSEYIFELCLDLTLNCLLYTEDVISEKYNNNGSIRFFTTLSLSFISNIISSIIGFFLSKLADYAEFFEYIIKDITYQSKYYLNIMKFKKLLCMKLTAFFFIQTLITLGMCYYLMIFCTVYHNTQGSIMINYLTGVAESIAISFGLTLITSIMRALSISCRCKSLYYPSRYFFENF